MGKYEDALERAKAAIKKVAKYPEEVRKVAETIFPELAETEDERIRKNCVHFLELQKAHHASTIEIEECIAWLEKQKEHPKSADSIPSDCVSDAKCGNSRHKVGDSLEGRRLADEVVAYLIKSGYQPTIKDTLDQKHFQIKIPRHKEDFFQSKEYKHCREILDEYYYEGDFAGDVYTLYVLWQKEQKPAEWSDRDKHILNSVINLVHATTDGAWGTCIGDEIENWLKSLRPQPGLSKEDFIKFGNLEYERGVNDGKQEIARTHWKPSEEQMKALDTYRKVPCEWSIDAKRLDSLYHDLEKL